jgi:Leucine-rich repeat (LRR) protein
MPADVFELPCLKVLSLRHNKLKEIPSGLRKLTMLQDLNVAGNRLEYLPWEILGLIKKGDLQQLTVNPNPFKPLKESDIHEWYSQTTSGVTTMKQALMAVKYEDRAPPEAWAPVFVATSSVELFDREGFRVTKKQGNQQAPKIPNNDHHCPSGMQPVPSTKPVPRLSSYQLPGSRITPPRKGKGSQRRRRKVLLCLLQELCRPKSGMDRMVGLLNL